MTWRGAVPALVLVLAACGGGSAATPVVTPSPVPSATPVGSMTFGGSVRTFIVYRPTGIAETMKIPVLIALHGYTVDAQWMIDNTRYDDLAKQRGFEVVYPQGIENSWNAGRCCGHNQADDVGFIRALIDDLVSKGGIDPKRVFVAGMSNGAFMAQRLACELAERITAVASVSGSLVVDTCNPGRAIAVLEMHGVDDDVVPFAGGTIGGLTHFPPTMTVMKGWAAHDGCATAASTARSGPVLASTWARCRGGVTVVLDAIDGAGHTWFNPTDTPGVPDATQVTWAFFAAAPPLP